MEEILLEIIDNNLDSQTRVCLFLDSTNSWVKGVKLLSLANECVRYTYYEINAKEKNPTKRFIERITPIECILDIKLEHPLSKDIKDLNKDLELEYIEEEIYDDEEGDDFIQLI